MRKPGGGAGCPALSLHGLSPCLLEPRALVPHVDTPAFTNAGASVTREKSYELPLLLCAKDSGKLQTLPPPSEPPQATHSHLLLVVLWTGISGSWSRRVGILGFRMRLLLWWEGCMLDPGKDRCQNCRRKFWEDDKPFSLDNVVWEPCDLGVRPQSPELE